MPILSRYTLLGASKLQHVLFPLLTGVSDITSCFPRVIVRLMTNILCFRRFTRKVSKHEETQMVFGDSEWLV